MKRFLRRLALRYLWYSSDDAINSMKRLSDIYSDVPKKLDVYVFVYEFHEFDRKRKEVLKWLNRNE